MTHRSSHFLQIATLDGRIVAKVELSTYSAH
jgi:hypothetical protein